MDVIQLKDFLRRTGAIISEVRAMEDKLIKVFLRENADLPEEEWVPTIATQLGKIFAIRVLRDKTGNSLVECRDRVESLVAKKFETTGN